MNWNRDFCEIVLLRKTVSIKFERAQVVCWQPHFFTTYLEFRHLELRIWALEHGGMRGIYFSSGVENHNQLVFLTVIVPCKKEMVFPIQEGHCIIVVLDVFDIDAVEFAGVFGDHFGVELVQMFKRMIKTCHIIIITVRS